MPINIYIKKTAEEVAYLADDDWGLPSQLFVLEVWLDENQTLLKPNDYVADIGFVANTETSGSGGSFSCKAMKIASALGVEIFFSEYPR
ncbi:hypothetical protein [Roseivirga pacifica]|uniref:hypothetical protein n=1 Tax=Roseivirga pacifica TaxID=1267423 RepID=UPI003BB0287F